MEAFADVVRQGKALYIGVSEWRAEEIRAAHALARELQDPAGLATSRSTTCSGG